MIVYTKEAAESHINRIIELQKVISSIPGNVLSLDDSMDIGKYLTWLKEAIESEQRKIDRAIRKRP